MMNSRSARDEVASRRPGDQVRHQAILLGKLAAGEDDRLGNSGAEPGTVSISETSTRCPRTLTWRSVRPGMDQAAVRLHHAEIAGQIKPALSAIRVRQEHLAGQLRLLPVARGKVGASDRDLADLVAPTGFPASSSRRTSIPSTG